MQHSVAMVIHRTDKQTDISSCRKRADIYLLV